MSGIDGIREVVKLTPEWAAKTVCAIGTFFGKGKNQLVGHDARTSGPLLAKAVISGLTATDCKTSSVDKKKIKGLACPRLLS